MLKRLIPTAISRIAAIPAVAAALAAAACMLGCDVMEQDVDVYPPYDPPGEEDKEDTAQNLLDESH